MSQWGQESTMMVGRLLCMWQMSWRASYIETRTYSITLFRTWNVNGEIFQNNCARHMLYMYYEFMQGYNVQTLPWSARSPDLNQIEHLRDAQGQRVRRRNPSPDTSATSYGAVARVADNPQHVVQRLMASRCRRCPAVAPRSTTCRHFPPPQFMVGM